MPPPTRIHHWFPKIRDDGVLIFGGSIDEGIREEERERYIWTKGVVGVNEYKGHVQARFVIDESDAEYQLLGKQSEYRMGKHGIDLFYGRKFSKGLQKDWKESVKEWKDAEKRRAERRALRNAAAAPAADPAAAAVPAADAAAAAALQAADSAAAAVHADPAAAAAVHAADPAPAAAAEPIVQARDEEQANPMEEEIEDGEIVDQEAEEKEDGEICDEEEEDASVKRQKMRVEDKKKITILLDAPPPNQLARLPPGRTVPAAAADPVAVRPPDAPRAVPAAAAAADPAVVRPPDAPRDAALVAPVVEAMGVEEVLDGGRRAVIRPLSPPEWKTAQDKDGNLLRIHAQHKDDKTVFIKGLPFDATGEEVLSFLHPLVPSKIYAGFASGRLSGSMMASFVDEDSATNASQQGRIYKEKRVVLCTGKSWPLSDRQKTMYFPVYPQ